VVVFVVCVKACDKQHTGRLECAVGEEGEGISLDGSPETAAAAVLEQESSWLVGKRKRIN